MDLEFSHNIQTHSVTKTSPFNIILGYEPIPIPPVIEDTQIPSLSLRLKLLSSIWKEALAAHDLARTHMARHGARGFKPFKLGDKWAGYPSSENQWLPETELSHATKLLKTYKKLKNL
ncbi:hypothetical protein M0805_001530 [Coniferiporia weirii]|nr:hypothetical protein M0805_001530 [Coniferiporia weirii]